MGVLKSGNGPQTERVKKLLTKIFKDNGLKITIKMKMHEVNFLDVTFNILEGTYKPYKKPEDKTMYINKESNHPEYIKKELPNMIQARLSAISSNEKVFKEAVGNYQQALINSGYKEKLEFHKKKQKWKWKWKWKWANRKQKEKEQEKKGNMVQPAL